MSRPLRIEYPNAWYHVMNRGRRKENVFLTKSDYLEFIKVLREASDQFGLVISAFCLMPNHYHLLVQTPHGNLSRCMRHVNGVYTQRFNKAHDYDGQLFRGRYKAVLVEDNQYLLQVMRYIHRNPLEAKLVKSLQDFPWSSHHGYVSKAQKWNWLEKQLLLGMLSQAKTTQTREYKKFIVEKNSSEIETFYSLKNMASILGEKLFKDQIKERFGSKHFEQEVSRTKELAVASDTIFETVCNHFSIDKSTLMVTRRGVSNTPRDIAIYLTKKYRLESLEEIGSLFDIAHYSTVSNSIRRVRRAISQKNSILSEIEIIEQSLKKSQEKI